MTNTTPIKIYTAGLLFILLTSGLLFLLVPNFEYFGGELSIYKPGQALPEVMTIDQTVSNKFLLTQFTKYGASYWLVCIVIALLVNIRKNSAATSAYTWIHITTATIGFSLIAYLNPYLISPKQESSYLNTFFAGGIPTEVQWKEMCELTLWYDAINTPTSMTGIALCLFATLIFLIGLFKGGNGGNATNAGNNNTALI